MSKKQWAIFLVVCLLLLCGFSTASASTSTINAEPTTLHVQRVNLLPNNHYVPFYPRILTNRRAVQHIYNTVLALPQLPIFNPPRVRSCPADYGLEYHLTFFQNDRLLKDITIHTGGCHFIDIGTNDFRAYDSAFIHIFTQNLGISEAVLFPVPSFACTPHSPCPASNS